jgi:hypothetical protein
VLLATEALRAYCEQVGVAAGSPLFALFAGATGVGGVLVAHPPSPPFALPVQIDCRLEVVTEILALLNCSYALPLCLEDGPYRHDPASSNEVRAAQSPLRPCGPAASHTFRARTLSAGPDARQEQPQRPVVRVVGAQREARPARARALDRPVRAASQSRGPARCPCPTAPSLHPFLHPFLHPYILSASLFSLLTSLSNRLLPSLLVRYDTVFCQGHGRRDAIAWQAPCCAFRNTRRLSLPGPSTQAAAQPVQPAGRLRALGAVVHAAPVARAGVGAHPAGAPPNCAWCLPCAHPIVTLQRRSSYPVVLWCHRPPLSPPARPPQLTMVDALFTSTIFQPLLLQILLKLLNMWDEPEEVAPRPSPEHRAASTSQRAEVHGPGPSSSTSFGHAPSATGLASQVWPRVQAKGGDAAVALSGRGPYAGWRAAQEPSCISSALPRGHCRCGQAQATAQAARSAAFGGARRCCPPCRLPAAKDAHAGPRCHSRPRKPLRK